MSQIIYRQRVRDRKEAEKAGGISAFTPQAGDAPDLSKRATPRTEAKADHKKATVDPVQVQTTAEMLIDLSPEDRQETLDALQKQSPEFHARVLEALPDEAGDLGDPGDGYDLSNISGDSQQPAADDETDAYETDAYDTDDEPTPNAVETDAGEPDQDPSPQEIAAELAQVEADEYSRRLTELEDADPELFQQVTDELLKMNQS